MQQRVRLTRFNPTTDGELLWNTYQDPQYCEFFRRIPPTYTRDMLMQFETITQAQLFTVLWDEWPCGFAIVGTICPYALSCQAGLLLFPDYRDKVVDQMKIAHWSLYRLCEMLFERTTMRRVSFRFLKSRTDIEHSFQRAGFLREGDYKESAFCYGMFQDELEYTCTQDIFKQNKEYVTCLS